MCSSRRSSTGKQTLLPAQANNFYVFPAIGMAIYATQARRVTDEMFVEAARAIADQVGLTNSTRECSIHLSRTSWKRRSLPLPGC